MKIRQRSSYLLSIAVSLVSSVSSSAMAADIGDPAYYLRIWGVSPDATTHPLADNENNSTLLGFASHRDAVDGKTGLLYDTNNIYTEAKVTNDGDVFAINAFSANNYGKQVVYSGSAAEVIVLQSFTKDTADASLTYTYTIGFGAGFVNPEFSQGCPIGEFNCLQAGLFSTVSVYDSGQNKVWDDHDSMMINQNPGGSHFFRSDVVGNWPWQTTYQNLGYSAGSYNIEVRLPHSVTSEIDLSGIDLYEEFTVEYVLYGYAFDFGSYLGSHRGTRVYARDPLDGDTGVKFDLAGLTPTNQPYIPANVPLPAAFWLFPTGLACLGLSRHSFGFPGSARIRSTWLNS